MTQIPEDKLVQILQRFISQIKTDLQSLEGLDPLEAEEEIHWQLLMEGLKLGTETHSVWFNTAELLKQIQKGVDEKLLAENLAKTKPPNFAILPLAR